MAENASDNAIAIGRPLRTSEGLSSPKIQYNFRNNHYIPELMKLNSVEWCEYLGYPQV